MTNVASPTPLAVGVTGGIGSGKSEVCAVFSSLGAIVYSADTLAKQLLDTDPQIQMRVKKSFGAHLYKEDGKLDRKALARLTFSDDTLLARLNAIVHPKMTDVLQRIIENEKRLHTHNLILVEAALIYEAGIEQMFDYVIVVDAGESERLERVVRRDASTRADILQRMKAQHSPEEKAERADFVLRNTGTLADLRAKCEFLFSLLSRMSAMTASEG